MQDLNEIFHRRRERAMHKIQLNKNTKHSREKKTVLNIISTNKVKRRNSGLDKQKIHRHAMHARVMFFGWVS